MLTTLSSRPYFLNEIEEAETQRNERRRIINIIFFDIEREKSLIHFYYVPDQSETRNVIKIYGVHVWNE